MIEKVSLIGSGNLATQLGKALKRAGLKVVQVYSRTEKSAKELADILDCAFTTKLENLQESDLFVVAVKDSALPDVLKKLEAGQAVVVHTAGSVPMDIFANHAKRYGVFYPLQTFSKQREVDFSAIPVCLEASSPEVFDELAQLARKLSGTMRAVGSEDRKTLHLAAVFACNFVNHFYQLAAGLLESKELNFDLLKPLITETAQKVMTMKPADAQTGPAVRFDETIIKKHLNLLDEEPHLRKIYSFVSESIYNSKKNN